MCKVSFTGSKKKKKKLKKDKANKACSTFTFANATKAIDIF